MTNECDGGADHIFRLNGSVILIMAVYRFRYFGKDHLIDQIKFRVSAMLAKDHRLGCRWLDEKAASKLAVPGG